MALVDGKESGPEERKQSRWNELLADVVGERQTGLPWWKRAGIFWAWAAGFALGAGVVVAVLLGIVDLMSPDRLFDARRLSDWLFWSSAILMVMGLVSPSAGDVSHVTSRQARERTRSEDRSGRLLRNRIRRMYDPWRWRLWAGALLAFGLSMLIGLLA